LNILKKIVNIEAHDQGLNIIRSIVWFWEAKDLKYDQFVLDVFLRLRNELELVLEGLTVEELNHQPEPRSNSIGWLIWHSIRSQDRMNADLFAEEQLWISEKWHAKFNRQADPKDTGVGHSIVQVADFRAPDVQTYLQYYQAVFARTREYILTRLSSTDLEREVVSLTLGITTTVELRLIGTINNFQHIGQAGYIKGMLKGKGWYAW
jgi:hypothetical protein